MLRKKNQMFMRGLALVLLIALLAGCGQTSGGGNAPSSAAPASATKTDSGVVTVDFSYPPYGYDSAKEDAFWKKYIDAFQKENPNIKINMTVESWDNVYTKWDEYWSTGNTPDIGYCDGTLAVEYGLQKKALPVTGIVTALGGPDAFSKDCSAYQQNGEYYCVPNCIANIVLAYRTDLLAKAGYTQPPKNWDELMTMAKALTKDGVYGLGVFTGQNIMTQQFLLSFIKQAGGKIFDEKGNLVVNSPENLKALTFMTDLVKAGVVPPSANTWAYGDDVNVLGTGKIALDFIWGGYGTLLQSMFPDDYKNIAFTTMPVGPSGESGSKEGDGGFFIFNNAKHVDAAKKFIEFMSRKEISKEWSTISGNVSPYKDVATDPELTAMNWYKAVSEQTGTAVDYGYNYGYVPGMDTIQTSYRLSQAVVDVLQNGMTPTQALASLEKDVSTAMAKAKNQ